MLILKDVGWIFLDVVSPRILETRLEYPEITVAQRLKI